MSHHEIVIEGTLKADGTLELDQKPNLPPGRVQVVLRPTQEPAPTAEGWWQYMQRARKELEEAGSHFMNEEEMKAHLDWLREGDLFDDMLRQVDQERPQGEQT